NVGRSAANATSPSANVPTSASTSALRLRITSLACLQVKALFVHVEAKALHLHRVLSETDIDRRTRAECFFFLGVDSELFGLQPRIEIVLQGLELDTAIEVQNRRGAGFVTFVGGQAPALLRSLVISGVDLAHREVVRLRRDFDARGGDLRCKRAVGSGFLDYGVAHVIGG